MNLSSNSLLVVGLTTDEVTYRKTNPTDLKTIETYTNDALPLFVDHYWQTRLPKPLAQNVAYSFESVVTSW